MVLYSDIRRDDGQRATYMYHPMVMTLALHAGRCFASLRLVGLLDFLR
jgi:hypothetical protein